MPRHTGAVNYATIPPEMPGEEGVWKAFFKPPTSDDVFLERSHPLARAGWTMKMWLLSLGSRIPVQPQA